MDYYANWRSVDFQTDLDLIAPLGRGSTNAALWFKAFMATGKRYKEVDAAYRRAKPFNDLGKVLPSNDPLLREAERWCDMAHMRFYPDLYPPEELAANRVDERLMFLLGRSFAARGYREKNEEDFRRAIRLGRLMREDDMFIGMEIGGLYCIQIGMLGIYNIAVEKGNMQKAVICSNILGEIVPLRCINMKRWDMVGLQWYYFKKTLLFQKIMDVPKSDLDLIIKVASKNEERRFSLAALNTLRYVRFLGTKEERERVIKSLRMIIDHTEDSIIKAAARRALKEKFTKKELDNLWDWLGED